MHMESGSMSQRSPGRQRHSVPIPFAQARQKPNPALTAAAHESLTLMLGGHMSRISLLQ